VKELEKGIRRRPHLFYGWYVLAASFTLLFVNVGAQFIFGLLVKPMQTDFAWSRGAVSSAAFLNLTVYAISILVTGRLYDRWGAKWVIVGSALLVALGFGLMASVHSLWQFLLYYGVVAAAGFGGTSVPLFGSLIGRWFKKRRGLAESLAIAGHPLGQFVLIPLLAHAITASGWRSTCLWIAGFTAVFNVVLAFGVIRGDPPKFGLKPYGSDTGAPHTGGPGAAVGTKGRQAADSPEDLSLWQAMRTRSLWLFTVVMFICGAGDFFILNHLVAMVTDRGIAEATGASMLAWCGLLGLGGLLLAGPVVDKLGTKLPVAFTFAFRAVLFTMLLLFKGTALFWVFALGMGFTLPITAPILPTLVSKLYGLRHIGFICGFVTTIHMLGGGLWSYLAGVIFDSRQDHNLVLQDYNLVLLISAIMAAVAVVCTLLIRERRHLPPVSSR